MTLDATTTAAGLLQPNAIAPNGIHPDQHALVDDPRRAAAAIAGDDGGVVRANGVLRRRFERLRHARSERGRHGVSASRCSRGFRSRRANLNKGLADAPVPEPVACSRAPASSLMGGTQDNGTFEYTGSSVVWPQIIYGDGGQSGWNAADSTLRFNSFFGQNHDANFHNGDPTKWVIISGKIAGSPEGSNFYAPIIADPESGDGRLDLPGLAAACGARRTGAATRRSSRRTAPSSRRRATTRSAVTSYASAPRAAT